MADNREKTEAEILEETMQNLGLEPDSEVSQNDEIESNEDELVMHDNDELEAITDDSKEETSEQTESSNEKRLDEKRLDDEDYGVQKKRGKLHKILIGVVGVLFLLILVGAVMYFMGFFDPEPIKKSIKSKMNQSSIIKEEKKYEFKEKDIDIKRLNKKLNLLTKYEIVENDEKEAQKASEKEKLYQEAKRQLEEERQETIERIKSAERARSKEAIPEPTNVNDVEEVVEEEIESIIKENQENESINTEEETPSENMTENNSSEQDESTQEPTANQTMEESEEVIPIVEEMQEVTITENEESIIHEEMEQEEQTMQEVQEEKEQEDITPIMNEKSFIKFIKISTQQKEIYKSFVDQLVEIDNRVILCRDDRNLVEIFVGPFDNEYERKSITQEYIDELKINAEIYDFTEEEYNKRCNY